jgi:VIT1/CCC1 family predicted Fe2+/Mn2+ transporter
MSGELIEKYQRASERSEEQQEPRRRVRSRDKYDRSRQISHKIGVLAARARNVTRTTSALSHLILFVTHLFSRVSAAILTYADHYPTYRTARGLAE